ncbi:MULTISPECIES: hypothetical protein [Bizionia]|nr:MULTISPECIES: hypothetical protein [Bizionia]
MRIGDAQLRYYFGIKDPESLPLDIWARRIRELEYIRQLENPDS